MGKSKTVKPKIPLTELNEVLNVVFGDFKYMVIAIDKEEFSKDKEESPVYAASNFKRDDAISLLETMLSQMKGNKTYEATTNGKISLDTELEYKQRTDQDE